MSDLIRDCVSLKTKSRAAGDLSRIMAGFCIGLAALALTARDPTSAVILCAFAAFQIALARSAYRDLEWATNAEAKLRSLKAKQR